MGLVYHVMVGRIIGCFCYDLPHQVDHKKHVILCFWNFFKYFKSEGFGFSRAGFAV